MRKTIINFFILIYIFTSIFAIFLIIQSHQFPDNEKNFTLLESISLYYHITLFVFIAIAHFCFLVYFILKNHNIPNFMISVLGIIYSVIHILVEKEMITITLIDSLFQVFFLISLLFYYENEPLELPITSFDDQEVSFKTSLSTDDLYPSALHFNQRSNSIEIGNYKTPIREVPESEFFD